DRYACRRRVRLEPPTHLVAVHLRHHQVHEDDVRGRGLGELDPGGTRAGRPHVPTGRELERAPDQQEQIPIVVNDQGCVGGSGHRSWLRTGLAPILAGRATNIGLMMAKVYILDDDVIHAKLVAANLGPGRFRTQVFDRPDALLAHHAEEPADAIITDELTTLLGRALAERPLLEEGASLEQARGKEYSVQAILGQHPQVEAVRAFVRRTAAIPRPNVLLLGESGTGKNLVARAIHYSSAHSAGRFVEINCSALPATLLEAELFGYKKGAFTDAREAKRGLIE